MKWIKKCPTLMLLIGLGLLFTIIGIVGRFTIYADQKYDPVTMPILSVMFTGMNDDIYPWQIFMGKSSIPTAQQLPEEEQVMAVQESQETAATPTEGISPEPTMLPEQEDTAFEEEQLPSVSGNSVSENALPDDVPDGGERLQPLRESTHEEYLNHISADIYGDAGVLRAASYAFDTVDESYFDDALFIGDSRTVGLRDYTDLSEHADFYCETSLTIYKVLEENFKGLGTVREALENNDYGKIYLMVGINELGRGTTEDFIEQYTLVVDTLHQLEPDARIFIQGIMGVSAKKNSEDAIFNNSNINARNHAIATLADNKQFFYIDVNEVVCDEEGNLKAEYTFDQIHLLGVYNELWKQFLMNHGVLGQE